MDCNIHWQKKWGKSLLNFTNIRRYLGVILFQRIFLALWRFFQFSSLSSFILFLQCVQSRFLLTLTHLAGNKSPWITSISCERKNRLRLFCSFLILVGDSVQQKRVYLNVSRLFFKALSWMMICLKIERIVQIFFETLKTALDCKESNLDCSRYSFPNTFVVFLFFLLNEYFICIFSSVHISAVNG